MRMILTNFVPYQKRGALDTIDSLIVLNRKDRVSSTMELPLRDRSTRSWNDMLFKKENFSKLFGYFNVLDAFVEIDSIEIQLRAPGEHCLVRNSAFGSRV